MSLSSSTLQKCKKFTVAVEFHKVVVYISVLDGDGPVRGSRHSVLKALPFLPPSCRIPSSLPILFFFKHYRHSCLYISLHITFRSRWSREGQALLSWSRTLHGPLSRTRLLPHHQATKLLHPSDFSLLLGNNMTIIQPDSSLFSWLNLKSRRLLYSKDSLWVVRWTTVVVPGERGRGEGKGTA